MAAKRADEINLQTPRFELTTQAPASSQEAFARWAADARIMAPLNLPTRALSEAQVRDYFAGFDNRTRLLLVILERERSRAVGFWNMQINPVHRTCSLHLALGEATVWGRGATEETGVCLIDWLFGQRGIEKVTLSVPETNRRMRNLLRHLGWPEEALLPGELAAADGTGRIAECRLGLLKSDWPPVRQQALARLRRVATRKVA